jgi:glycosyltransferase involved in cell wall biosynthesis
LVAKIRNFSYIAHFHLDVEPSGALGGLFILYKKFILGKVLRSADKVLVFSREQSRLVQRLYKVQKANIAIVPNGVGKEYFYEEKRVAPKKKLNLLYVGRLTVQKRVDRLVDALSLVKSPVKLTIVGDGEDRLKLEKLAQTLQLKNISFVGRKNGKRLLEIYRRADALVISSDKEGMPLVVLEAMACGLPIIASNVIGLNELVKGTGILVNDPSPKTFANSIDQTWKNKMQLGYFSKKSIKKAKEHSWDKVVGKIELIYEKI